MLYLFPLDGLSIPFFSFGRNVRSRTVSLSRTWTSRTNNAPDWLLWARRTPAEITRPSSPAIQHRDVERAMEEVDPTGLTEPVTRPRDDAKQDSHVPELGPAAMLSDATAKSPSPPAPHPHELKADEKSPSPVHVRIRLYHSPPARRS